MPSNAFFKDSDGGDAAQDRVAMKNRMKEIQQKTLLRGALHD